MRTIGILLTSALCVALPFSVLGATTETQTTKPTVLAERGDFRGGGGHGGFRGGQGHQRTYHQNTSHHANSTKNAGQKQQSMKQSNHNNAQNNKNWNHNGNWNNNAGYHAGWNGYHSYNNTNVYYVNGYPYNGWYNGAYLWGGVVAMGLIAGTYYYAGQPYSTNAQCYGACAGANNPNVNCHSICHY